MEQPYFDLPYIGQPMRREQNPGSIEFGQVSGVKHIGTFTRDGKETKDFVATIDSGFQSTDRIDARTRQGFRGWFPVTAEELSKQQGPALIALADENKSLREQIDVLHKALDEILAAQHAAVAPVIDPPPEKPARARQRA